MRYDCLFRINIELIKRYEWYEAVLAALPPEKQQEAALKMYEIILRERGRMPANPDNDENK